MVKRRPPKCPKCNSQMIDDGGLWKCLSCGRELEDSKAKHRWFEENKDAIIETYQSGAAGGLRNEWGISPSTWFTLRKRWGVALVSKTEKGEKAVPSNNLPQLPLWQDNWAPEVQVRYLDLLEVIITGERRR